MKKLLAFAIVFLIVLVAFEAQAARRIPSPEVPNLTCNDGINNDGDDDVDAADADCSALTPFSDGKANAQAAIKVIYANGTDDLGDFVAKPPGTSYYQGELAFWDNFAEADTYLEITYQGTNGLVWAKIGSSHGINPNNAADGFWLPDCLVKCSIIVGRASSDGIELTRFNSSHENYRQNAVAQRAFALNGNNAFFLKSFGIKIYCAAYTTDPNTPLGCPEETPAPQFDIEIFEVGANTITNAAHAAWDDVSPLPWQGYDETTGLTLSEIKMVWDNAATDVVHVRALVTDTEAVIPSTSDETDVVSSGTDDYVRLMLKSGTGDTMDSETTEIAVTPFPINFDRNYPDGVATTAYSASVTDLASVTAGVSYLIYFKANLGFDATADDIIKGCFTIGDKNTGVSLKLKNTCGTSRIIRTKPAEWHRLKLSSTTIPASPNPVPNVTVGAAVNVSTTSFHVPGTTDIDGEACLRAGTVTETYGNPVGCTQTTNGAFTIALTGLDPDTTYFYVAQVTAANQTGLSSEGSQETDAVVAAANAYVAPTVQGNGNCLTKVNACLVATALALWTGPGWVLELGDGVYTGASSMIVISGKNCTALLRCIIRAENDGAVRFNGQAARLPVSVSNADHWTLEGFDAHNSSGSVITIKDGADNNIVRRVCAWDTPENTNSVVWAVHHNVNTLLEDVCGFGKGRKIFSGSQLGNKLTIRRAWGRWERSSKYRADGVTINGPKHTFTISYSNYDALFENVIGTWSENMSGLERNQMYGILSADTTDGLSKVDPRGNCSNSRYRGSIGYLLSTDSMPGFIGALWGPRSNNCLDHRDIVLYNAPGTHTNQRGAELQTMTTNCNSTFPCPTTAQHVYRNATEIGWSVSSILGDYQVANRCTASSVAGCPNIWNGSGTNGARVCKRYKDGVLTDEPLWPWPMNERIKAALKAAGKTEVDVTLLMEQLFGTIPAECRND